jgi:hypothetical protein
VRGASGGSGLIRFTTYHPPLSSPRFSHCPQHLLKTALGRNTSFCGTQTKKKEGKKKEHNNPDDHGWKGGRKRNPNEKKGLTTPWVIYLHGLTGPIRRVEHMAVTRL